MWEICLRNHEHGFDFDSKRAVTSSGFSKSAFLIVSPFKGVLSSFYIFTAWAFWSVLSIEYFWVLFFRLLSFGLKHQSGHSPKARVWIIFVVSLSFCGGSSKKWTWKNKQIKKKIKKFQFIQFTDKPGYTAWARYHFFKRELKIPMVCCCFAYEIVCLKSN